MALLGACLALVGACSSSNSEVPPDGAAGTTGASGSTGAAGTGGGAGGGASCPARTTYTEASHSIVNVTWPAGTASMAGTGQVHLWVRIEWTASGNALSGSLQACGSVLPPTSLAALVGGGMVSIDIPDAAWDAPTMTKVPVDATQTGWDVGTTVSSSYAVLTGFTLANGDTAAWPSSYTGITTPVDSDGDTNPGLTAVPRDGNGYVLPPTSLLGALGAGSRADKLYIVSRNVASTTITRTSCDEASGGATYMHFDNHVMGCHVSGGGECAPGEVTFIDQNRTIYQITGATLATKVVADGATCADVRAALPM